MRIVKCKICGKEFEARTANSTMCSAECRRTNHNRMCVEAQRKRRQIKKERIAAGLEAPIPRKKPERRWIKPIYKPRKCEMCGKEYRPEHPRQKYCSEGCRYPHRSIKEESKKPMSTLAEINAKARSLGMHYGDYVAKYGG